MTARELSLLIWSVVGLTAALLHSPTRTALLGILRAFRQPSVIRIIGLYLVGLALLILVADHLGWWSLNLIVPTMIWVAVSGLRLPFSATDAGSDRFWLRKRLLEIGGLTAVIALVVDVGELPLWGELLLAPLLTLLVIMQFVAGRNPDQSLLASCLTWILGLAGVSLLLWGLFSAANQVLTSGISQMWQSLVLPIWLGTAALVFAIFLAVFLEYGVVFRLAKFSNQDIRIPLLPRLAFVTCLRFRVKQIHAFRFPYLKDLAVSSTWRDGYSVASEHRGRVRRDQRQVRKLKRLEQRYRGTDATELDGRRLDNREFAATRDALQNLHRWEQLSRERHGTYKLDVMNFMTGYDVEGLPEPHEIQLRVSKKGQAYVAFRTTISGWKLGIGALRDSDDCWLYDSRVPPSSSVPTGSGWVRCREHVPPNWLDEFGEDF